AATAGAAVPTSLGNRWLISAILFTVGGNFAFGTYEVVWSIFLERLGAGLELIGLTFAMFGLPILVLSPFFGRRIDRGSLTPYLVAGGGAPPLLGGCLTPIPGSGVRLPPVPIRGTGRSGAGAPRLL